jgi:hypothetical protein
MHPSLSFMIEARDENTLRMQGLSGSGERSGLEKNLTDVGKDKTIPLQALRFPAV